eukprot:TRINITY_DN6501_c0_g1_i1.p1 TRINITY_DN6501_c0_g1~~TRINITY_DN6501_c0_g1_i1.p1  ORF type:complete len:491 (+),score=48.55 TRINITY_DN6501_c0_g1_i1:71-1474(+)
MSEQPNSVINQLLLNLKCLGFDMQAVVLDKVPARGLPPRYLNFKLDSEMFGTGGSNTAAVEILLFFIFQNMPWEGVASVLPCTGGISLNQMGQVRRRYAENASHFFNEMLLCFPCLEIDQLSSFKKQASNLLDLLKHILPPDLGHARRVLTESGPRMAYVCFRLTSYILQHQATGTINPVMITGGPDTTARRNVLKSMLVRETLKFQEITEGYLQAETKLRTAATTLSSDYEDAALRISTYKKRCRKAELIGKASMSQDSSKQPDVEVSLAKRRSVIESIRDMHKEKDGLFDALEGKKCYDLTQESLQGTWEAAGGTGKLLGEKGQCPDVKSIVKRWAAHLEDLQHTLAKQDSRKKGHGPPVIGAANDLSEACTAQMKPLAALLEKARTHNDTITTTLRPRLSIELASLQKQLVSNPLNSLISLEHSLSTSPSPSPASLLPQPVQQSVQRDTSGSPGAWLVASGDVH